MLVIVVGREIVGYVAEPKSQNEVGSSHDAPSNTPVVVDTGIVNDGLADSKTGTQPEECTTLPWSGTPLLAI